MFTKLVCTKSFKNRDDGHQFTEMGLWCHWWTLLKSPLYLDDVALIVRSSLLVVDVGTIFVWIKSEGESWGNFHIVLNMRPIFGGRREKIFQLRCCQTPDPDLNQCILMLADQCSWGESGYNDNLYPKIPQLDQVSSKNKILWYVVIALFLLRDYTMWCLLRLVW